MKLNQKHAHSFGLPHRRQAGASLIELLVSILVFAVGVAGVASLQILSLRDSFDNSQRSHVVTKAQELIDRVRRQP